MSTAIKSNRLSSEEKTAEFELPATKDFSKKGTIVPPTPAIQQKVHALRSENQEIKTQIEQVKTEGVRKQDESTRVFNLRQAQLVQKIKDLEIKKAEKERIIQKMLDEKGHNLAKTSKSIDELSDGMGKLNNIRQELQNFFESATQERKKNADAISAQGTELQTLGRMIQECQDLMAKEYAELQVTLQPLLAEKVELEKSTIHLKSEMAKVEEEIKILESKKFDLNLSIKEAHRDYEASREQENQQLTQCQEQQHKLEELRKEIEAQHHQWQQLQTKKEAVIQEIEKFKESQEEMHKSGESIKWSLVSLNEQHEHKKAALSRLDQECAELRKRVEELRTKEADLFTSCGNYSTKLHQLQGEVSGLEASREAAQKLQEDAMAFLQERRDFYQQHVEDLEYNHKTRMAMLEKEYKDQKEHWDNNFSELEHTKKAELEAKLEEHTVRYHALLKETQDKLMDDILKVVKRHLTRTVFETGQQRAELAHEELAPLLKNYFNQTPSVDSKPWQQWKPWFYATSGSFVVIAGLVVKLIWF